MPDHDRLPALESYNAQEPVNLAILVSGHGNVLDYVQKGLADAMRDELLAVIESLKAERDESEFQQATESDKDYIRVLRSLMEAVEAARNDWRERAEKAEAELTRVR